MAEILATNQTLFIIKQSEIGIEIAIRTRTKFIFIRGNCSARRSAGWCAINDKGFAKGEYKSVDVDGGQDGDCVECG